MASFMNKITIPLNSFSSVVFDMDGTMIDNMQYHKRAWISFFATYDILITDDLFKRDISGKSNNHILQTFFAKDLTLDEIKTFSEKKEALYREIYKDAIHEIRGLKDVLETLKGYDKQLAIATTATQKNRDFALSQLALSPYFAVIKGEEHVKHGKPHPEIYLATAKDLGVAPNNCIVFEDTPSGVAAAVDAGMTVVGLLTTHSKEELHRATYHIDDYSDVAFS